VTNLVVAAKRRNGEWRSATIIDNEFQDAAVGKSLADIVLDAIGPALSVEFADGTEVSVNVVMRAPKAGDA
jgi:hypothetical protein